MSDEGSGAATTARPVRLGRARAARLLHLGVLGAIAFLGWLVSATEPARLLDDYAFDRWTAAQPATPPQVVVIEIDPAFRAAHADPAAALAASAAQARLAGLCFRGLPSAMAPLMAQVPLIVGREAERLPASKAWRLKGADAPAEGVTFAATSVLPAEAGLYRSTFHALPARDAARLPVFESACAGRNGKDASYLVPMSASQNIPRITASQLAEGVIARESLGGLVAIVPPLAPLAERRLATALAPGIGMPASQFSAYAVQALRAGQEVHRAEGLAAALACILAVALGALAARLPQVRRWRLPLVGLAALLTLFAAWSGLRFGMVLLPLAAMVLVCLAAGLAEIFLRERERDRYLADTLEEAINLSFDRALFHDPAALPAHLIAVAELLRLPGSAVVGREAGRWTILSESDPALPGLSPEGDTQRRLFERTLRLMRSQRTADGEVWLSPVAGGEAPLLWLYALPEGREGQRSGRIVREIAAGLRQARGWQHRLLGGTDGEGDSLPVDVRVASAAHLITLQGEQISQGLEALDTAVLIFHPAGFALQSNSRMQNICEKLELDADRVSIVEAILALTTVDIAQAEAIVRRMLLRGGEIRVPMREVAARNFVLRVGATRGEHEASRRVIVLEAVDVSELDHLAELRLAVGVFIDRQLRNDLEAISLGATIALDPRTDAPRQQRLAERIRDAAARATGRLEDVSELLEEKRLTLPGPCYPIEARKSMLQALERAAGFAEDAGVAIDASLPGISGFTLAEPTMLTDMVEAILRLIVADTARGGAVRLVVEEQERRTVINASGGFGMPFDRLVEALDARAADVPPEFQVASAGFAQVRAWKGSVAYWSAAGNGYKFTITLRRIG